MKVNELRLLIRQIVKEEVASEVSKAMGKVLVEMVKEIKRPNQTVIKESVQEEEEEEIQAPILKTKNAKLNSALAATAHRFKPLPRQPGAGLVELMEGGFDKIGQNESTGVTEPATKIDFLKSMVGNGGVSQTPSVLDNGAAVPDALKAVFKKDFRAVMKKMDEQRTGGGGGYIDPSKVLAG